MFVYQNKNDEVCVTFKDNKPVTNPEYVITVDKKTEKILINGGAEGAYKAIEVNENIVYETAEIITSAVSINVAKDVVISIPEDTVGDGVYHVKTGGSLVINGEGTINGVGKNDYNMAIWADGGNVTINGGIITNVGATASVDSSHFDLVYAKSGSVVTINGGYFECETPKWTLNLNDKDPGKIVVRGGTFYDFDPSRAETEPGGLYNYVDDGYKVIKEGKLYTVVKK